MFSMIRKRLTYANAVVTLALVFAMTGGAYAAKHYLITSTKQISPKVLKALQGKAGPVGPEGKAGAPGPAGKDGVNGVNGVSGKDGAPGESVTAKEVPAKAPTCKEQGGAEFKVGSTTTFACNGQTGFTEALPSKKSETGTWAASGEKVALSSISFPIPLAEAPQAHYIGPEEGEGEAKEAHAITSHECGGTALSPSAAPGNLCIFTTIANNVEAVLPLDAENELSGTSVGKDGAVLAIGPKEAGLLTAAGPWVVTEFE